ncbi:MAG: PAS domain-containing protein [Bacteroidota bacterium]|nr:PAS domain-containing protein [Bacteroidota bacterium]
MNNRTQFQNIESNLEKIDNQLPKPFGEMDDLFFPTASDMYDELVEDSLQAMCIEGESGKILRYNERFCRLFGYSEKEMSGLESSQIFDLSIESSRNLFNKRNANGNTIFEINCIKKSGEKFPCRISSVAHQDKNGKERLMNTVSEVFSKIK